MHTEPELLTLLALGELVGTEDDRAHLVTCTECAAELAELKLLVGLVRSTSVLTLSEPGPRVWAAVHQEIRSDADVRSRSPQEPTGHARLIPVQADWSQASGEAELATDGEGRRVLQVSLHADLPSSGLRQAWLVHRDDPDQRQALGVLDGRHGLWTVEHAIDLELYPFLEISQQNIGSTGHSGQTIVRGELLLVA
jgi:hypothetical protein